MSEPNPQWQEAGIERVRLVIASALTVVGRTAEEIERIAKAIAIRYSLTVEAATREGVIDQLTEILGREGYFVSKKVAWEKIGAFRKRIGLNHRMFHRLLKHAACPPVELLRGSGMKQVLAINPNPVFESFLLAVKGTKPKPRDPNAPRKKQKTVAEGRPSRRKPAHLLKRPRYKRYQTAETK